MYVPLPPASPASCPRHVHTVSHPTPSVVFVYVLSAPQASARLARIACGHAMPYDRNTSISLRASDRPDLALAAIAYLPSQIRIASARVLSSTELSCKACSSAPSIARTTFKVSTSCMRVTLPRTYRVRELIPCRP
ncbi:hypothetical protein C8T65DRAFT_627073 [Cerioporus squamosus]|nr:hypothetical protein C8T65DRAFT_627073 [Cerioporus squamosus]